MRRLFQRLVYLIISQGPSQELFQILFCGSLETRPLGRRVCRPVSATSNTIPALLSYVNTFYDKIVFFIKIFNLNAVYHYIPVIFALKQAILYVLKKLLAHG